jgi:hypothetical protein
MDRSVALFESLEHHFYISFIYILLVYISINVLLPLED